MVAFFMGFLCALIVGVAGRILLGMKLRLFFLNQEPSEHDPNLIPISADLKKRSLWRTLVNREWEEDIEVVLADYDNGRFTYQIGFHVWHRFYLILKQGSGETRLDGKLLKLGEKNPLRSGMTLEAGSKGFSILVTPLSHPQIPTLEPPRTD